MKKIMMICMIAVAATSAAFSQMKMPKPAVNPVDAQLIDFEKKGWETWKMQDPKFLQGILADDGIFVDAGGVTDRTGYLKNNFGSCKVASYSLEDFNVRWFDKNTAMVTYKAAQDAMCGGNKVAGSQWASSMYMKRGGKWINTFFQTSNVQ
jgi:hypothetical protein